MSSIKQYPAMRGKLGSTEYYTFIAKARDLAASTAVTSPDDWKNMTIDEMAQRKLDISRVVKFIAPYMARDKNRFFGAVVIATDKNLKFTPFTGLLAGQELSSMFQPFQKQLDAMGMLILDGSEEWNPLDGQHRIAALRCATTGKITTKDGKNETKVSNFNPNRELGDEDVTVIMIPNCSTAKARKIFTKINRNARKTTKGENLLMDDEDIVAILTREVGSDIFGGRLIHMTKADIGAREGYFTTLATLERANLSIFRWHIPEAVKREELPPEPRQRVLDRTLREVWEHLVANITHFADGVRDKSEAGDKQRVEARKSCLLFKPRAQWAMVEAFARLTGKRQNGQPATFKQATDRLNKIDWRMSSPEWDRVLMSGGKILKQEKLAADIIYYRIGGKLDSKEQSALLAKYREARQNESEQLPSKVS